MAIRLARHYDCPIISADSRQIYRGLNIGTAKPTQDQLDAARHYFIDTKDITEPYSAGVFAREANALLKSLFETQDVVIVSGGTGLYYQALIEGFDPVPEVDTLTREHWIDIHARQGIETLQAELKKRDPAYYNTVDRQNAHRLIRALTVIDSTGKPYSSFQQNRGTETFFTPVYVLCTRDRAELYARINNRVDNMLSNGLLDEARSLLAHRHQQAMQTVGYKELFHYLDGECDFEEAVDKIKQHTRNYAKRQMTWFRNQGSWQEFCPPDFDKVLEYISQEIGTA